MHAVKVFVVGVFVLFLTSATVIAETEQPSKYRADAVMVLHGIGGMLDDSLFCNNKKAIRDFELSVQGLWRAIKITVPSEPTLDPIRHTYDPLIADLKKHFKHVEPGHYDWRKGMEWIVENDVLPVYRRLVAEYGRVHLVGDSAGGNIIRLLLEREGDEHVGRIAFCGTPLRGAADAYFLWNGGVVDGNGIVPTNVLETMLYYIQVGCGCAGISRLQFLRNGCAAYPYPFQLVHELVPEYLFVRRNTLNGVPYRPESLCERNPTLSWLEEAPRPWNTKYRAHFFLGKKQPTAYVASIKGGTKDCGRLKWPDGKYLATFDKVIGDNRVIVESGQPSSWYVENPDGWTFTDEVSDTGKLFPESKNNHGKCTTVFTEEMRNFLLYGRTQKPATTTTSTTTTTLAVTTTTAGDTTTTVLVTTTTTTLPSGSAGGVILGVVVEDGLVYDDMLDLVYHQRVVVALADLDGDGELDDDVALHPNTVWSADDANIIQFYPDGNQMTYVGFLVGTTTMRVSFDPDGDGPMSPYTDAMSVTIDDGTFGGG